jgi:uncharacterized protein (DUF1800 family)
MKELDPRWAWKRYVPSAEEPWDLRKVGHLYRRASFGATWSELRAGLASGPDKIIDDLLKGWPGQNEFDRKTAALAESVAAANSGPQARAWWLYRMLYSPHPLAEKLTLFWHNHFATSNAKVNNAAFMLGQYELMRRHALGNFRSLLEEMSRDPAMMVWLDTSLSKKGMPNENYARELMELFSLGIGHYTETDIREAARAFTGWEIKDGKAVFSSSKHDDDEKKVLGQKGKWTGEDIVRICLEQPSASSFIVTKLYRFLVSETAPTPSLLEPLADQFRATGCDFGSLVATMLRSNLFFSVQTYRGRVKAPVDFALGIVRALEGRVGTIALAEALEQLGQNLFYPPSVKGWDGGPNWINGQTLLFRQNLALALTSTEDGRFGRRTDPALLVRVHGRQSHQENVDFFLRLFLEDEVPAETRSRLLHYLHQTHEYLHQTHKQTYPPYWTKEDITDHGIRSVCHLVLTLPEFQLD